MSGDYGEEVYYDSHSGPAEQQAQKTIPIEDDDEELSQVGSCDDDFDIENRIENGEFVETNINMNAGESICNDYDDDSFSSEDTDTTDSDNDRREMCYGRRTVVNKINGGTFNRTAVNMNCGNVIVNRSTGKEKKSTKTKKPKRHRKAKPSPGKIKNEIQGGKFDQCTVNMNAGAVIDNT